MKNFVLACVVMVCAKGAAAAVPTYCQDLDAAYPQPGRSGLAGENAFRPLPLMAPVRTAPGAAGTLNLSISADHVSTAKAGKPTYVYVGNYPVTDIPVFRVMHGAATSATLVNPVTGKSRDMPDICLDGPDWGFGGTQWALVQGDTLDVLFSSRLDYTGNAAIEEPTNGAVPCRASNLHTHGLLVSPYHPRRPALGTYGDYVLDVTQPPASGDYDSTRDTCGTVLGDIVKHGHGVADIPLHYSTVIPGTPGVSSMATGEHPSGLFWYHPHPHGFSQPQVSGGTTGAITVGALTDYACPAGDGTPGNCTLANTDIRVLALKDTEIQSYGEGMWATVHSSESGYCSTKGGERHGECQAAETSQPGKWVFTINGVQYPTMHAPAGRMEIWRLVNSSANMSYLLSLVPEPQGGAALPFQVLAVDGVAVRGGQGSKMRTDLLMMPATRVEIAIPAPPQGGTYLLRNSSLQTGQQGSGDIWPEVDLARLVWAAPQPSEKAVATTAGPSLAPVVVSGPATPVPHALGALSGVRPACTFLPGDTRVIYFVHRFVTVFTGGGAGASPYSTRRQPDPADVTMMMPPSGLFPSLHEVFGLIAGVRHEDGRMDFYSDDGKLLHDIGAVWLDGVHGTDTDFPGFGHNDYGTICTVKGNVEPWELQNWTAEDHNFHIHQSRFTLNPNGVFQFPDPTAEPTEDPGLRHTDFLVRQFAEPTEAGTFHDTVPVPRGQSLCRNNPNLQGCGGRPAECSGTPGAGRCVRPGIMSVLMDFSRNEQVGTFVYHCHILEHEDGGMMAMIHVLCPPGDSSCAAQQAADSICRPKG